MMDISKEFNGYVAYLSEGHALGISQEELAHRADIGRTYIARLELAVNQPSLSVLFHLCAALEATPAELLEDVAKRVRRSKRPSRQTSQ